MFVVLLKATKKNTVDVNVVMGGGSSTMNEEEAKFVDHGSLVRSIETGKIYRIKDETMEITKDSLIRRASEFELVTFNEMMSKVLGFPPNEPNRR